MKKLCNHEENESELCSTICSKKRYLIQRCYTQHKHKKLVFRARIKLYGRIIVKSLESPDNYEKFNEDPKEFNSSVKRLLKDHYLMENWTQKGSLETVNQKRSFWKALNTYEYIFSEKYKDEKIFAPVVGKCSNFLVSKELAILRTSFRKNYGLRRQLQLAMNIITLVEKLDNLGLTYCDFKLANIGLDTDDNLMKIVDADNIRFKNKIEGQECAKDEDCFQKMRCSSKCTSDKVCKLQSSNIQYVCGEIFLQGNNRGGLLGHSSEKLRNILAQCKQLKFNDVNLIKDAINQELQDSITMKNQSQNTT